MNPTECSSCLCIVFFVVGHFLSFLVFEWWEFDVPKSLFIPRLPAALNHRFATQIDTSLALLLRLFSYHLVWCLPQLVSPETHSHSRCSLIHCAQGGRVFNSLVRPGRKLPPVITKVTGITNVGSIDRPERSQFDVGEHANQTSMS